MAGDWIKMRGNLWDDPRVGRLCDLTDSSEGPVIGALYWLWATADQHTEDGRMPGLTLRQIDRKTELPGFGAALCEIGWMHDEPQGVVIVKFEEHNGTSAKRRCVEAKRKAESRTVSASDADTTQTDAGVNARKSGRVAELEEEKSREEKKEQETPRAIALSSPAEPTTQDAEVVVEIKRNPIDDAVLDADGLDERLPPCPHRRLIAMFAATCPELVHPRPESWNGAKSEAMRHRWRWLLTSKREDGARYAEDAQSAVEWFGRFFKTVNESDFLCGRQQGKTFTASLEWLMQKRIFDRVIEGRYTNREASR